MDPSAWKPSGRAAQADAHVLIVAEAAADRAALSASARSVVGRVTSRSPHAASNLLAHMRFDAIVRASPGWSPPAMAASTPLFSARDLRGWRDRLCTHFRENPPRALGVHAVKIGSSVFLVDSMMLIADGRAVALSEQEQRLLRLFSLNAYRVLDRQVLAVGKSGGRAADVAVARLRRRLEPQLDTPRYLRTVRSRGYAFTPDLVEETATGAFDLPS